MICLQQGDFAMFTETNIRTTVRRVVDTRTLRSQPRAMQVSLPALRCLGELPDGDLHAHPGHGRAAA
jgi:hypothetical protein